VTAEVSDSRTAPESRLNGGRTSDGWRTDPGDGGSGHACQVDLQIHGIRSRFHRRPDLVDFADSVPLPTGSSGDCLWTEPGTDRGRWGQVGRIGLGGDPSTACQQVVLGSSPGLSIEGVRRLWVCPPGSVVRSIGERLKPGLTFQEKRRWPRLGRGTGRAARRSGFADGRLSAAVQGVERGDVRRGLKRRPPTNHSLSLAPAWDIARGPPHRKVRADPQKRGLLALPAGPCARSGGVRRGGPSGGSCP